MVTKNNQLQSRAAFAAAQGISRQMVDRYVQSGMPLQGKMVDPKLAREWIKKNILARSRPGETFAEARTRAQIATAGIREMELEILRGRYIDAEKMRDALERIYIGAREVWLQAIGKISARLGLEAAQEKIVKEIIYAALTNLSSGRILENAKCKPKPKKSSRKK